MVTINYRSIEDPTDFGRVAVLMGGVSTEKDISILSGNAILEALRSKDIDAHALDINVGIYEKLNSGNYDRVFNILHGAGGEDGTIQGLLEILGLPYTGSGVAASALTMDKLKTKQLMKGLDILTPEWWVIESEQCCNELLSEIDYPLIIKPASQGSSIGMESVQEAPQLLNAWKKAAIYGNAVIAERYIEGQEFTASILQDKTLPLVRIETDKSFYNYEAKYISNKTKYICPTGLSEDAEHEYSELALKVWDHVGGQGWGRIDFIVEEKTNLPMILEVNTVPGMTSHSLVPMAAAEAGIDFATLSWQILETSFEPDKYSLPISKNFNLEGKGYVS
ncbi:MAG: D-alanine--D-alanine ligase [Pseudomonadota bacterium]|nr:D-alanine--D-alanine ligase [Pseudomonadota bacterium]